MAEVSTVADVASSFSSTIQGYATLGASLLLGVLTVYGYYRKLNVDLAPPSTTPQIAADANLKEIALWLSKLLEAGVASAANTKLIAELLSAQQRSDELERAYKKGRDETLDRATALVAQKLNEQNS